MDKQYLTVSAITEYLKYKLVKDPYLKKVYLEGEITNFRERNNHQYFTLKDEKAAINITMFASRYKEVDFKVENGLKVVISGHIDLYIPNGTYSLIAHSMQIAGEGALHQRFEEIKARLTKEGLFAKPKKPLPKYPQKIAVVTSETGAVIHDIIRTVAQRFPMTKLVLYPTLVQGPDAAEAIAQQIQQVNLHSADYDLVIVGRGGGSYEDLFAFNEERVVRAAAKLKIPLITSVGHETDYTLIDMLADYSAATPTMAAEQAVPDRLEQLAMIQQYEVRLQNSWKQQYHTLYQKVARYAEARVLTSPEQLYKYQSLLLDKMQSKLAKYHPQQLLQSNMQMIKQLEAKLQKVTVDMELKEQRLINQQQKLSVLNPESVLKRGYAYVLANGQAIESKSQLNQGDELDLHLIDGIVKVEVKEVEK